MKKQLRRQCMAILLAGAMLAGVPSVPVAAASGSKFAGEEWYDQIETVEVNREPAHATFTPYESAEKALANEKSALDAADATGSEYYQSLNGTWNFYWSKNPDARLKTSYGSSAASYTENWNTSGWDTIQVPSNIQTQKNSDGSYKYDKPIYTNQSYPWANYESVNYNNGKPSAPTVVNGVGHYKRTFTIPDSWNGRQVFVSFQGVESAFYLYINGKRVGYGEDSYTADDFNITSYLKRGENTIAVEVYRWSDGSYLENQDFIRLSGIFRDVYLYSKANVAIRDIFATTDLNSDYSQATVNLSVDVKNLAASSGDYTVTAQLYDAADQPVWGTPMSMTTRVSSARSKAKALPNDTGVTVKGSQTLKNPKLWFADSPYLYRLLVQLKDSKGNVLENTCIRLGMREVGTASVNSSGQQQLQINGKKLMIRGTNRQEIDPEKGRAVGKKEILTDLQLMKSFNINAIRTSHYPNNTYLYDLADELGFYICDEANIESHIGAIHSTIPSGSPIWNTSVMDRTKNMLERDKNHPSILIWSLGNEATYNTYAMDSSYCFYNSSQWILQRDPSRIRKYERDNRYTNGNRAASMVDVYSSQYWSVDYCLSHIKNTNNKLPYIQSEYAHAMGNGLGNLAEYWDIFRTYDNANGGFIWDWIDQTIYNTQNGKKYFAYGGDWGETVTDRDFCANGMVNGDRTPSPELYEAKKVLQEVSFYNEDIENGKVKITNEFTNTNLNKYRVLWTYTKDNEIITKGELDQNQVNIAPGTSKTVQISLPKDKVVAGSDYVLTFSVIQKQDAAWANAYGGKAGNEIAFEQFELGLPATEKQPVMNVAEMKELTTDETDSQISFKGTTEEGKNFQIEISKTTGYITKYQVDGKNLLTSGPVPNYWRAATSNDIAEKVAENSSNVKNADKNFKVNQNKIKIEKNAKVVKVTIPGSITNVNSEQTLQYTVYANGMVNVTNTFSPSTLCNTLARVGMKMTVPAGMETVTYYGKGEQENYSDRNTGAKLGVYKTTVSDMFEDKYIKPQENGNRTGTRWVALMDDASQTGLLVSAEDTMEFSALHYTAEELASKKHPYELKKLNETILTVDYAQRGFGNASCGAAGTLPKYQLPTGMTYTHTYSLRPVSGAKSSDTDFVKNCMEKSNQNINAMMPISGITVDGVALEDFTPSTKNYTYERQYKDGMGIPVVDVMKTSDDVTVSIRQIQDHNGTVVITATSPYGVKATYYVAISTEKWEYLSDMKWTSSTNGYFENTRDMCGTNPLQLMVDDTLVTYSKGVGMHAPASVTVNISGKGYTRFTSTAGVNYNQIANNNGNTNVNLVVKVDGKEKFRANNIGYNSTGNVFTVPIDVDVTDARTVTVAVEKGTVDYNDHISWGNAKFSASIGDTDSSYTEGVIAARNVAAVTPVNEIPVLPNKVSGVLEDGTLQGEFPVTWAAMTQRQFSVEGKIVTVSGTADLGKGKTLPVTASVRVAKKTAGNASNLAPYASVTQDIAAGNQSDNLASIINGITKPGNVANERWTNYNNRTNSDKAALTFTWSDEKHISSADLYYYIDSYSAYMPSAVKFEYSADGKNYTQVNANATKIETYDLGEHYTYKFAKEFDAMALRITLTQQGGTTSYKCVGLTEAEINGSSMGLEVCSSADLAGILVDGEKIADFASGKTDYTASGEQVTVEQGQNVGVTILPVLNNVVRILTISEDGTNEKLYAVTLVDECRHVNTEVRNAKEVTCAQNGYTGDTYCVDCGQLLAEGSEIVAVGHQWDEGVIIKEATKTEDGIRLYTCTVCQGTREEIIPATGVTGELEPSVGLTVTKGSDGKMTLTGQYIDYENEDSYRLVTAHGLLYYPTVKLGRKELTVNTSGRTRVNFKKYQEDGSFVYDMQPVNGNTKYTIRAFMAYTDENGETVYVYSDPIATTYNSLP